MFLSPRLMAGYTLTFAAFALAAMSGMVSYTGISGLLPTIPGIGFLGFVIAVTTVALGIAVIAEAVDRNWRQAVIYAGLLGLVACSDGYTNILALEGQVSAAEQATADRNQKFAAAEETLALTREEMAKTHELVALMNADAAEDIRAAQTYLASKGLYLGAIDGIRGGQTLAAMRAEGAALTERLAMLQAREDTLIPVVAAGAVVVEAPFTLEDAALYGVVITAFGILLSFAGSALVNTGKAMDEREAELDEREADMDQFETELLGVIEEDDDYAHDLMQVTYALRRQLGQPPAMAPDVAPVAGGEEDGRPDLAGQADAGAALPPGTEADDMAEFAGGPNLALTVKGYRAVRQIARERELADEVVHDRAWDDKFRSA